MFCPKHLARNISDCANDDFVSTFRIPILTKLDIDNNTKDYHTTCFFFFLSVELNCRSLGKSTH